MLRYRNGVREFNGWLISVFFEYICFFIFSDTRNTKRFEKFVNYFNVIFSQLKFNMLG